MRNFLVSLIIIAIAFAVGGCSNNGDLTGPDTTGVRSQETDGHCCLGYFQLTADPSRETLDVVPLRETAMHLNARRFLEPPPLVYLSLEHLEFNGNHITADIGLRHPFIGLNEFTGFDVCGVFISNGSKADLEDPELRMTTEGDTRLLNPDGFTRWWNPLEFPADGTMFSYHDGLLGTPDAVGNYNATINGYKFFCDALTDPTADVGILDPAGRNIFSAGQKNVRRYELELGDDGLVFNYAVDASWQFPTGPYPWSVPDDFGINANRPEAWHVSVTELDNTLWNDGLSNGGNLSLSIDVWDHYNADLNTVKIESGGNFDPVAEASAIGGGDGYSTYQIDITDATPAEGSIELFISIECEVLGYGNFLPDKPVTAYFKYIAAVDSEPPVQDEYPPEWVCVGYDNTDRCQNPNSQNLDLMNLTQLWANYTSGSLHGFKPMGFSIADGKVFFVCEPSGYYWPTTSYSIYCLSLDDGHEIWRTYINQANNSGRSIASPYWWEDKVYVGGDSMHCLNDETGAVIWTWDGGGSVDFNFVSASPKIADGRLFSTSRNGIFVCLDAETGGELWTLPYEYGELFPVTDGERVYYPSQTMMHCADCETGVELWSQPLPDSAVSWSGPTLVGDRLYQSGWYGSLYCFDKYDGTPIWTYDFTGTVYLNASPAPFVDPTDEKTVFALGSASSGSPFWAIKDDGPSCSLFWVQNYSGGSSSTYFDATAAIYEDYIIAEDRYAHRLLFIDQATGALEGQLNVQNSISAQVAIAFDKLVVVTDDSVECYITP